MRTAYLLILTVLVASSSIADKNSDGVVKSTKSKAPATQPAEPHLVSGESLRRSVSLDVPAELAAKRNALLAKAGAEIRAGIIKLSKQFPQLKRSTEWQRIESPLQGRPDSLGIRLYHDQPKQAGLDPTPPAERFHVTIDVEPPPPPEARVHRRVFYGRLGLVGVVEIKAGNPKLKEALDKIVQDALEPLSALNQKGTASQPASEAWVKRVRSAIPKGWLFEKIKTVPGLGKADSYETWKITQNDPMEVVYNSPIASRPHIKTFQIVIVAGPKISADDYRKKVEYNQALAKKFRGNEATLRRMGYLLWWSERTDRNVNRPYLLPTHFDNDHGLSITCPPLKSSRYEFKSKKDKAQASEIRSLITAKFQPYAAKMAASAD